MSAISEHRVHSPATLAAALKFLAANADQEYAPLAGGTDVLVAIEHQRESRSRWLDLWRLRGELGGIAAVGDRIKIGALTTMSELRASTLLASECALIAEAAATVGAVQIQNRATVAGNIANASPAGDTLPVWLMLDAEIELASAAGARRLPYADFHLGYRRTALLPGELITAISFERNECRHAQLCFRKIGTRAAQAISKVVMAAMLSCDERGAIKDLRLAFGSVAATPVRARAAERAVLGALPTVATGAAAASLLDQDIAPIDDVRSSAAYRLQVARNLVTAFVCAQA